jgi:glycine dehydrogenase
MNRAPYVWLYKREQHIKREKQLKYLYSSSIIISYGRNVCRLSWTKGLRYIAEKVHSSAGTLANALNKLGVHQQTLPSLTLS